jgi:ribosome recycling factor
MNNIANKTEKDMNASLQNLERELKNIRSNRANPGILDEIKIEVYGSMMNLRDVANVTTPEARQILITPYDAQNASIIGKAIEKANLNLCPVVDSNAVRINIPPMDEQQRKERVKLAKKKGEDCKVQVRNHRKSGNESAKKEKNLSIPEDEVNRIQKKIQELTDKFCSKVDEIIQSKEKEILEI